MTAADDVDALIEQFYQAQQGGFLKGNSETVQKLFSHQDDVTLANPFGPPVRGWQQVAQVTERAASVIRDGEMLGVETIAKYVTPELAYVLVIERAQAKVGGSDAITPITLRTTMIFRPEDGVWKIVHRHADPITTTQAAESIIKK